jgi:hypothetical protein
MLEEIVSVRVSVAHLQTDMTEAKQDIRRLDDRVFKLVLLQLATLAAALASVAASVVAALVS